MLSLGEGRGGRRPADVAAQARVCSFVDPGAAWSYDGGMVFDPGFRITEKVELASRCDRGWQPRSRVITRRIGRRRDGRARLFYPRGSSV